MYIQHMAKSEVRTQIYLPAETHRALKTRARRDRMSMAGAVREALVQYLVEPSTEPYDLKNDPIMKLAGIIKGGPRDASVNHDKYIYEALHEEYKRWQSPVKSAKGGRRRRS